MTVRIAVTADADFTDQFELRSDYRTYVKSGAVRKREVLDDGVEFSYRRGEWRSCTTVTAEPAPDGVEETGTGARRLVWTLDLEPHGSAELALRVAARPHGAAKEPQVPASPAAANDQLRALEGEFVEGVAFPTGWPRAGGGLRTRPLRPGLAAGPRDRARRRGAARTGRRRALVPHPPRPRRTPHLPLRPPLPPPTRRRHPPGARRDPGDRGRPGLRGPAGQDRARGTARRAGALRAGAVRPLLRLGRRDPAVPGAPRRVRRADRRHGPGPPPGAQRPRGDRLDARPRRASPPVAIWSTGPTRAASPTRTGRTPPAPSARPTAPAQAAR